MREDLGWTRSATAWIETVAKDKNRRLVLDRPMLEQVGECQNRRILDVGCGEGRFCRMLSDKGASTVGIDPTGTLIRHAKGLHPEGHYIQANGEALPFRCDAFDVVVSYLVLIDIPDYALAIREMARVVKPGGRIVVANLQSFATSVVNPWVRNEMGEKLHFRLDWYNEERADGVAWNGISIVNFHRPLHMYMNAFLEAGLRLTRFLEPLPSPQSVVDSPAYADYFRVPIMLVTVWDKV